MFYFKNQSQITVYFSDGSLASWKTDHCDFKKVENYCKTQDWISIEVLYNKVKAILVNESLIANGQIIVIDEGGNETFFSLSNTDDPLLEMITLLQKKGVLDNNIEPVKPFLINMLENPYINATNEIYEYCKNMDFEITEDGCFLAYKAVNDNLTSVHDGITQHAIGEYTEVDIFDTNREQHCSTGLHFCARSYLKSYQGSKIIVVKVNPKDVVSIPTDYNFTKGRCKKYMTVGIIAPDGSLQTTNMEKLTKEKVVKSKAKARIDRKLGKVKALDRIEETAYYIGMYKDPEYVADLMNISTETVKRNMRKFYERARS